MNVRLWDKSNQNIQSYMPLNLEKLQNLTVFTVASTNIEQSSPNLVKMYVTIRSQMSSIMDLIGPKLSELSALDFENFPYLTLFYSLASANIDQSAPNVVTIHIPMSARMSSIMDQIEPEHPELFAL